mmetsp:Transcript_19140/g.36635  ORF Transcript_19140/g.36635 Transcript_19140/m.36635 type:complete len:543 (+) Transcript_19140:653-2281(+)
MVVCIQYVLPTMFGAGPLRVVGTEPFKPGTLAGSLIPCLNSKATCTSHGDLLVRAQAVPGGHACAQTRGLPETLSKARVGGSRAVVHGAVGGGPPPKHAHHATPPATSGLVALLMVVAVEAAVLVQVVVYVVVRRLQRVQGAFERHHVRRHTRRQLQRRAQRRPLQFSTSTESLHSRRVSKGHAPGLLLGDVAFPVPGDGLSVVSDDHARRLAGHVLHGGVEGEGGVVGRREVEQQHGELGDEGEEQLQDGHHLGAHPQRDAQRDEHHHGEGEKPDGEEEGELLEESPLRVELSEGDVSGVAKPTNCHHPHDAHEVPRSTMVEIHHLCFGDAKVKPDQQNRPQHDVHSGVHRNLDASRGAQLAAADGPALGQQNDHHEEHRLRHACEPHGERVQRGGADAVRRKPPVVHHVEEHRHQRQPDGAAQHHHRVVELVENHQAVPDVHREDGQQHLAAEEEELRLQDADFVRGEVLDAPAVAVGELDLVLQVQRALAQRPRVALRQAVGHRDEHPPRLLVRKQLLAIGQHVPFRVRLQAGVDALLV